MKKRKVTLTIYGEWECLSTHRCQICGKENEYCTQMWSNYVKPIYVCQDCFIACEEVKKMNREELVYTNKIYPSFTKFQVDEVCDAYEQRIKELEAQLENVQSSMYAENVDANMALVKANERIKELEEANKRTQKHREEVESSESNIRQEMFKMKARIKELETDNSRLHQANFDGLAHFNTLKEDYARLKAMKWISVDDVKPQWGKEVKVKFKDGSEDEVRFSHDYKWVSKGMGTCESSEVTHWMPLPTTEEK